MDHVTHTIDIKSTLRFQSPRFLLGKTNVRLKNKQFLEKDTCNKIHQSVAKTNEKIRKKKTETQMRRAILSSEHLSVCTSVTVGTQTISSIY